MKHLCSEERGGAHDWEARVEASQPGGMRRYRCRVCGIWGWRNPMLSTDVRPYSVAGLPVHEPRPEWGEREPGRQPTRSRRAPDLDWHDKNDR